MSLTTAQAREELAYAIGMQACIWGRPLWEYALTNYRGQKVGASYFNCFRYHEKLKTGKDRYVVTPNNVTLDGYCAAYVGEEPVVVCVPAIKEDRWYIVQIGSRFDEVIQNIGGSKGPEAGIYIITGPDFNGEIPLGMKQVKVPTVDVTLAVRVFVNGESDMDAAIGCLRSFNAMPLSKFREFGMGYVGEVTNPERYEFKPKAPKELEMYDKIGFGMQLYLSKSWDVNHPMVINFHKIGLSVKDGFDFEALDEDTKRGLARAAVVADDVIEDAYQSVCEKVNGWRYTNGFGRAGHDYTLRATLAKKILGANVAEELVYPNTNEDADGVQLHGDNNYVLHFEKNEIPPVSVFWNLNMFDSEMFFYDNEFGRFSIGSTTDGLKTNDDGSIDIYIQHEKPADVSNWLPAPKTVFNLTMRMYGAKTQVLTGAYRLPAVKKA